MNTSRNEPSIPSSPTAKKRQDIVDGTNSAMNSMMKTTTGNFMQEKKKHEAQAERLIHSVNAVTDLLRANTELREALERS